MYRGRLQRDLEIWTGKGLLSKETAVSLLADYDSRPQSFTVGRMLMMLAAILIAAALLLFIASNWEAIPRIARVAMLIALIWAAYGGAAFQSARGGTYLPGALLLIGVSAFGASLALVGQMYHLSGDTESTALLWFLMCFATALLFRSAALTYYSGVLAWFYFTMQASDGDLPNDIFAYGAPALAVMLVALTWYTSAARAKHLAYTLVLAWLAFRYVDDPSPFAAWSYAITGAVLFLLATLPISPLRALARRAGSAPAFYALVLAILGLGLNQIEQTDIFGAGPPSLPAIVLAGLAAGFSVLAIALDGRDNAAVRYLGYAVFAVELLYMSLDVAGSMIGTSGIFLFSGVFLGVVAWLVIRLEKRFASQRRIGA